MAASIEKLVETLMQSAPGDVREYPEIESVNYFLRDMKHILFPKQSNHSGAVSERLAVNLDEGYSKLTELLKPVLPAHSSEASADIADKFFAQLPQMQQELLHDLQSALDGDPATSDVNEVIRAYPSIRSLTYHRIAHALLKLEVPVLPRMISESGHAHTGIDIHPAAQIGTGCFIDHGTGVVIGGTAIVGKNVRIYQGVTLGALRFPKDKNGNIVKGLARHPIVEDNVTIYSGATVLGRITLGEGSVIGGNVWVTTDVPKHSKILQSQHRTEDFSGFGAGI